MSNLLINLLSKIPAIKEIQGVYAERNALQQLYERSNFSGGLVPGRYYQLVDPGTGNVKGFSVVCREGIEYRMHSMFECMRQGYKCPHCGFEINLLKHIGAADAEGKFLVKATELETLLRALPVRPADDPSARPGPRFIDPGDMGCRGSGGFSAADRDGWDGPLPPGATGRGWS